MEKDSLLYKLIEIIKINGGSTERIPDLLVKVFDNLIKEKDKMRFE